MKAVIEAVRIAQKESGTLKRVVKMRGERSPDTQKILVDAAVIVAKLYPGMRDLHAALDAVRPGWRDK